MENVKMYDIVAIALDNDESPLANLAECLLLDLDNAGYDFDNYSTTTMFAALTAIGHDLGSLDTFNAATIIDTAVAQARA